MQRLKKQHEPTWVWRYKHDTEVLLTIWSSLTLLPNESIPDSFGRMLKITLHPLDFFTGETFTDPAASFDPFFMPTDKGVLQKKKNKSIEHTLKFPDSLGKRHKSSSKPTDQDLQLQKDLAEELQNFSILADSYQKVKRMTPFARPLNVNSEKVRTLAGSVKFKVTRAVEHKQGARITTLVPETYPDPTRPSATEIEILVAVIIQGLHQQGIELGFSDPKARNKLPLGSVNFVIPALVISVYPGAQVRVLYGYMVNKQLHLHFTKLQQFTKENFQTMLETTLRWAFAITRGQAAKLVTLPDIAEEDEEEAVEVEDWEDMIDEESEADVEDCNLHIYTTEEVDDHVQGTNQECLMNVSSNTSTLTTTTRKSKSKKNTKKKAKKHTR